MKRKKIPDDKDAMLKVFLKLCEQYADDADSCELYTGSKEDLLDFCHAYAYKINGIEEWK